MSESTPYAEFGAAFFGAVAAFALEALRRRGERHRENLAAGNEATMVLAQMYSVLRNYNQQAFIDRATEVRKELLRQGVNREPVYIEYLPITVAWNERSELPMNRLGFLLRSHDADILNRLSMVERGFLTVLATTRLRNEIHYKYQERARSIMRPGEAVPSHVVEELVGFDLAMQLKQLTEQLKADIPRTVEGLLSLSGQLVGVLGLVFPTGRVARFKPITVPVEGLSPPANTKKAAWWRRLLRALIDKWRKRRARGEQENQ
jgi:hypothetical protein